MSNTVIAYYSRTGKTRMVAEKLAAILGAAIEEIHETKSRAGGTGFLGGIKDTLLKCPAELAGKHTTAGRTAVVIGMPVWAACPPPAVRAYANAVDLAGRKIFAFCTYDGSGAEACLQKLAGMVGGTVLETLSLKKPDKDPGLEARLREFADRIRAATGTP